MRSDTKLEGAAPSAPYPPITLRGRNVPHHLRYMRVPARAEPGPPARKRGAVGILFSIQSGQLVFFKPSSPEEQPHRNDKQGDWIWQMPAPK